ncbi:hypothetical protein PVK06_031394 [Gossypium arboreum]|uniref:Uncharacterized protein n=1 Tax=Gossypium arboreum TaxID=29729 RepID=A0ABR0NR66_GOSAR|nr:hypothetical protein PVK06_031394 [Gossypium arboreum]
MATIPAYSYNNGTEGETSRRLEKATAMRDRGILNTSRQSRYQPYQSQMVHLSQIPALIAPLPMHYLSKLNSPFFPSAWLIHLLDRENKVLFYKMELFQIPNGMMDTVDHFNHQSFHVDSLLKLSRCSSL